MLRLFLKSKLSDVNIVGSIGELLAQYWHIGTRERDECILRLIAQKTYLSQAECGFLAQRAFDGMAWPFILLLLKAGPLSEGSFEPYLWQFEDDTPLRKRIDRMIAAECRKALPPTSLLLPCDRGLLVNLPTSGSGVQLRSLIFRCRRSIT